MMLRPVLRNINNPVVIPMHALIQFGQWWKSALHQIHILWSNVWNLFGHRCHSCGVKFQLTDMASEDHCGCQSVPRVRACERAVKD